MLRERRAERPKKEHSAMCTEAPRDLAGARVDRYRRGLRRGAYGLLGAPFKQHHQIGHRDAPLAGGPLREAQ
eukprot:13078862-Alexandrium_andersonii.AAC.1